MKWFWRINYYLSFYFFIIILLFVLNIPNDEYYANNNWIKVVEEIITFDGIAIFITMIIEWFQFPICLIIIIFRKEQRKRKHFIFLSLLVLLNLIKWLSMFLIIGQVTYKTI